MQFFFRAGFLSPPASCRVKCRKSSSGSFYMYIIFKSISMYYHHAIILIKNVERSVLTFWYSLEFSLTVFSCLFPIFFWISKLNFSLISCDWFLFLAEKVEIELDDDWPDNLDDEDVNDRELLPLEDDTLDPSELLLCVDLKRSWLEFPSPSKQ